MFCRLGRARLWVRSAVSDQACGRRTVLAGGQSSAEDGLLKKTPPTDLPCLLLADPCGAGRDRSAMAHMLETFPGSKELECRGLLGSFGIVSGLATQPMAELSGGQLSR